MKLFSIVSSILLLSACVLFIAATASPTWGSANGTTVGFFKATSGSVTQYFDNPSIMKCAQSSTTFTGAVPCFESQTGTIGPAQWKCCRQVLAAEAFMIMACIVTGMGFVICLLSGLDIGGKPLLFISLFLCFSSFISGLIGFAVATDWILNRAVSSPHTVVFKLNASAGTAIVGWIFCMVAMGLTGMTVMTGMKGGNSAVSQMGNQSQNPNGLGNGVPSSYSYTVTSQGTGSGTAPPMQSGYTVSQSNVNVSTPMGGNYGGNMNAYQAL